VTREDRERFESLLRERERETEEQLSLNAEATRPVSLDAAIGRVTRVDAIQHQQMALHAKRRLGMQLEKIRAALRRLDDGTYGECALCGEDIDRGRLEVAPEAPTCLECQRRLD
jgi:DnaK suppressor protein